MIHHRYQSIVFAFVMSFTMSFIMSFVITFFNLGWVDGFITLWLKSWVFALAVAFPAIMLVAPLVKKAVVFLIKTP